MHDLVFNNGLVVTPDGCFHGSVAVDDGIISNIVTDASLGTARRTVDLDGRILFPGIIDPHVHFGFGDDIGDDTMAADFEINSKDCLIGGVTTVSTTTMTGGSPLNELFSRAVRCGEKRSYCDFKVASVITKKEQIEQIPRVVAEGGVSFKFYTGYSGEQAASFGIDPEGITPELFYLACEAMRKTGKVAFAKIHAEEPTVRGLLMDRLRRDERPGAAKLAAWADTSPDWAESVQVFMYGSIAQELGVCLYPVHLSSGRTLETVRMMRRGGADIVAETLALYLSTTAEEMDAAGMGGRAKIQPPLRHEADREALWAAVADGTISTVGTDSLTYSAQYKSGTDFWECRVGVNLQVADTVPLLMNDGVATGRIDLVRLAQVLAENSARRYGLYPQKGCIAVGSDADLVVIDQDRETVLGVDRYRGVTDYSLWEGRKVRGVPVMTVLRGDVVMEDGEISVERPTGAYAVARAAG
jgi:dihydroorotase-like cyclic amidohydrolase